MSYQLGYGLFAANCFVDFLRADLAAFSRFG
jgi:hypothetical protein